MPGSNIPKKCIPVYDNETAQYIDIMYHGACSNCFAKLNWQIRSGLISQDNECPSWYAECCGRIYFMEIDQVSTFVEKDEDFDE